MESTSVINNNVTLANLVTTGFMESGQTTEDTFMEEVKTYTSFKIATFLATYWFPVLVPIGLVGNTLSFLVMIKPNNRKMSTCIYMAAISINDNIMMYICAHDYLVSTRRIHQWHPVECKCIAFGALFALQNSTFQILAMTIDKYIAIKWPHRAATYSTPRRARIIAGSVYVCALIYNIPHLFLSRIIDGQCFAYSVDKLITKVYSYISFGLNAIIPFTLLIHMNYVIVKTVRNSRKMFSAKNTATGSGKVQGIDTRTKSMKSAENQLTVMLLMVATLFLILLCPTYIRFIYLLIVERDTPLKYANSLLFFQISFKLYTTNSGINFFLYCTSGQKFRNDLKEILSCCCLQFRGVKEKSDESHSHATEFNSVSLTSNPTR